MTTQSMDTRKDKATPCYVSYLTFVNMLDHIKSLKVMPTQIGNTVWAGKFSGGNSILLTAALRFLKLLEGNGPTDQFRTLVFADAEKRKEVLREVLVGAYGADIANLSDKTPKMVDETLRSLGTTDSTHRKAVSFFVQAAKGAGITMPSTIAKRARNRPGTKPTSVTGSSIQTGLHHVIVPLIKDLAEKGTTWSKADRDVWKAAFSCLLDYAYPAKGSPAKSP